MKRLGLRCVPHAVEQLDDADQWWRENRDKAPDLLVAEAGHGTPLGGGRS